MVTAVLFDMGGTLEAVHHDDAQLLENGRVIHNYLARHGIEIDCGLDSFSRQIKENNLAYKAFSDAHRVELTPFEIWSQYRLRRFDVDQDKLKAISERLSHLWEITYYRRCLRPHVFDLLDGLKARGYRLAVISNTPSYTQVIWILREYGLLDYFEYVGLSSVHGFKKPHPFLFEIASTDLGVPPAHCAYVGDTISRDVIGARGAGFGMTFRIDSQLTKISDAKLKQNEADADWVITDLLDILPILERDRQQGG